MLWDEHRGKLTLVDLERAEIRTRSSLGIITVIQQHSLALEVAIVDRQLV